MQLTYFSDYTLRVLTYLALEPERLVTIDEIARRFDVSRAHLMKVVHHLGLCGYVETVRGRGGGLRLARPAEEIGLGEVVRSTEESMALVECFDPGRSQCAIEPACGLRGVLQEALAAFLAVLDRYTLADLVARRRKPLLRLLDASQASGRRRGGRTQDGEGSLPPGDARARGAAQASRARRP